MSNQPNNLNQDSENIQFDDDEQETTVISGKSRSKVTAPLKLLPESIPDVSKHSGKEQKTTSSSETPADVPTDKTISSRASVDVSVDKTISSRASLDATLDKALSVTDPDDVPTDTTLPSEGSEDTLVHKAKPDDKSAEKSDDIKFSSKDKNINSSATIPSRRSAQDNKVSFLTFNNKKDDETLEKNPDTAVLSEKSATWRKIIDAQTQGTTSTLGEQREVLFVIRGMIERVVMKESSSVTLGRFDTGTVPNEEIDLIPYGAIDRGVSRRHCKIQLQNDQLLVTDLQSTNGTFLAGVRLNPNEPTTLRKGDELLLGRLAVQVLFR